MFPWTTAPQASPSITNSWSLLKLMSIESVKPFNHLVLCHPLLFLLSIFPSIRVFSNESALPIRWPKFWNFSFSISPSNEYSGLISFRIDWFDLWVGKIPWRRAWQPTPGFWPGEFLWTEEPGGLTVHGVAKSRTRLSDWKAHLEYWKKTLITQQ